MSKKLIAVAAAAALALTGLVGVAPANANITVGWNIPSATTGDASQASLIYATSNAATLGSAVINVPSNNVLEYTSTAARSSLLKVTVTTTVGEAVTVTASGAAKIVDTILNADGTTRNSTAGASTYNVTATTTSTDFYVFTTSTANQSLTIQKSGNTGVYWFKARHGLAYNITATMPATIPATAPSTQNLIAKVTDVYGNLVTSAVNLTATASGAQPTITPSADSSVAYNSTLGGHPFTLSAAGTGGMGVEIFITTAPTRATGLAAANSRWFGSSNAADLAGQVTTLTAQVAALTAQLAATVTKAKYNKLARKWNRANPSNKVKLAK
ncbi:MAG: hypothetical protein RLZZ610_930 [Actinomycetota bacterium]|jgi:hypothetical protein